MCALIKLISLFKAHPIVEVVYRWKLELMILDYQRLNVQWHRMGTAIK